MDHYHILDAYRSNVKLVPIDEELANGASGAATSAATEFRNVFKAAHQTKEKHDSLRRREGAQVWSLAAVEAMLSLLALLFVASIANSDRDRMTKINYSLIVAAVFSISGVLLYVILFSKRMFHTSRHRKTVEEIYGLDNEKTARAYALAKELREKELEYMNGGEGDSVRDSTDPKVKKKIALLEAAIHSAAPEGSAEADPGYLKRAVRRGMMYTMTEYAGQTIDETVRKLRTILGSETYRAVEETDVYDIIDDVIIPKMIEAREGIVRRTKAAAGSVGVVAGGGTEADDQCDGWCGETVERLVGDALAPKRAIPADLLEQAWERCRPDMESACGSARLKTGEQRCAFGCAKVEEKPPMYSTIRIDNKSPGDNWVEQTGLKPDNPESSESSGGSDGAPAPPTAGLERLCSDAALADEDVDAAYFGQTAPGGPNKCYFHYSAGSNAGGRGTFDSPGGESFSGKLLYKEGHNVEVPGASPAEIANRIANEVRAVQSTFDLSTYDVHLYDVLRYRDSEFKSNRPFYEAVFDNLVEMLKPHLDEVDDMIVPSVQRINESLTETTARRFRKEVVWPVARSSGYLHIRSVRLDQKESYMPMSMEADIRRHHSLRVAMFVLAAAGSLVGYVVFTAEREASRKPDGRITLGELISEGWHRHAVAVSVLVMFWTIVFCWLSRRVTREVFNDRVKEENTRRFVASVYDLRTFLFRLTDTMPGLEKDDDTAKFDDARLPLMQAVHTNNVDAIKQFSRPDELVINVLTLDQKLEFVRLSQRVVKAYDRCNKLDSGSVVPFPMPEIIVYLSSFVFLAFGMAYMYSRFDVEEVAQRVERIRKLRPRVYMGDANAAREIAGLLSCAEETAGKRMNLVKTAFVGMVAVSGIVVTVLLINGNDEYAAALNSGFMLGRGRCVT